MKTLDQLPDAVTRLHESFDQSGLTFTDRVSTLAAFKESGHEIFVDDDGTTLLTHYQGSVQKFSLALSQWGRTGAGEVHVDKRSLPQDEKNPGGVRAKSDLKNSGDKAEYIAKFGLAAYEKLALTHTPVEEVKFQDEYARLTTAQKSELIKKGVNITSFPVRPSGQLKGSFIAHDKLAKEKSIRGR